MTDPSTSTNDKFLLRTKMREILAGLSAHEVRARSEQICERVNGLERWKQATSVLLFDPLSSEPDITMLYRRAAVAGKRISVIPQTIRRNDEHKFTVLEADLVLVPGLAFSGDGHRLGRGGGFFDWFLGKLPKNCCKVAVCFQVQLLERVPTEPYDVPVDVIVTESAINDIAP
jgi:5-formyltetrahydrofolate cyclo-ligase